MARTKQILTPDLAIRDPIRGDPEPPSGTLVMVLAPVRYWWTHLRPGRMLGRPWVPLLLIGAPENFDEWGLLPLRPHGGTLEAISVAECLPFDIGDDGTLYYVGVQTGVGRGFIATVEGEYTELRSIVCATGENVGSAGRAARCSGWRASSLRRPLWGRRSVRSVRLGWRDVSSLLPAFNLGAVLCMTTIWSHMMYRYPCTYSVLILSSIYLSTAGASTARPMSPPDSPDF
jgi:hypothetical protein